MARSLEEVIIRLRVTACLDRLRRAQEVGSIDPVVDLKVLIEVPYGPLYYRWLLHTEPVTNAQADAILNLVLSN